MSSPTSPPLCANAASDPIVEEYERQITLLLYRNNGFALGLSVAAGLLMAAGHFAGGGSASIIAAWFVAFLAVSAWRFRLLIRFRRHVAAKLPVTAEWRRPLLLGIVMSAIGWALASLLFMPAGSFELRLFTAAIIVSSVTGAIPQVGVWARAYRSYLLVSAVPVGLLFLLTPTRDIDAVLGCALFLYIAAADGGATRFRDSLLETVRLGVERGHLIAALERARDEADASSRAKTEFLANVSHEIRTPINAILGFADMASGAPDETRTATCLTGIRRSAKALLALLNDVLDMSKIESGMLTTEQTQFSLDEAIAGLLDIYTAEAHRKGLRLQLARAEDVPDMITGDPLRLHQILSNLLSNAIKFTERGDVTLSLRSAARKGRWRRLAFAVSDTGIGLNDSQRKHIFDSFTQADTSTTRRFGGTGLGLAISQQLVRLLGGIGISVDSVPGQGSRFSFELPVRIADAPASRHVSARATPMHAPIDTAHLRLLLGEDSEDNRRIFHTLLSRAGHHVTLTANGQEAVRAAESGEFDAIILDMHMPVMDGLEATCRIRQHEALAGRPRTPILMLTASIRPENREACLAAGADRYLLKPVDIATVLDALNALRPPLDAH